MNPVKLDDARYPVKLDKLWLPTWVIDPVKLDETVYPMELDEL